MSDLIRTRSALLKKRIRLSKNTRYVVHAIEIFHESTDFIVNRRISTKDVSFDCKKGCTSCCNLRVEVLPPEAFNIANKIKADKALNLEQVKVNLADHAAYAAGKEFAEYDKACPFLNSNGACSIYSYRPFKCRSYLSKNVEACTSTRSAEEDVELKQNTQMLVGQTVGLYKSKKHIMHPTELGQGVLQALEDEGLEKRWGKGEQVFELLPEKITL